MTDKYTDILITLINIIIFPWHTSLIQHLHVSWVVLPCLLEKVKRLLLQEPAVSKTGNPTKYTPRPHDEMKPNSFEFFGSELPVSSETLKVLDWSQILCC